ncbi:pathogen-associated molecular patterns-induced protein A70-like [Salvia divinorum]|uniref:Pathogen-associated molecular patterns-induced protein A70-like n=1 Tax=Salvia divinorum TaxID=28513 RepID=A0ABD1FL66_SALDI
MLSSSSSSISPSPPLPSPPTTKNNPPKPQSPDRPRFSTASNPSTSTSLRRRKIPPSTTNKSQIPTPTTSSPFPSKPPSIFNNFEDADVEEKDAEENLEKSIDEVYSQLTTDSHFSRTKSDTKLTTGEIPAKLATKMRKSASVKSAFSHFEEGGIVEARRPATVREGVSARAAEVEEGCVDAKADDFINRFKQQLKLQRLDSIIKYKDMIGRGR